MIHADTNAIPEIDIELIQMTVDTDNVVHNINSLQAKSNEETASDNIDRDETAPAETERDDCYFVLGYN